MCVTGGLSKEGQHFQRFMLAFREVCPEAFEELHNDTFIPWLEADSNLSFLMQRFTDEIDSLVNVNEWLLPESQAAMTKAETEGDLQNLKKWIAVLEGFTALVNWHLKYNLHGAVFATDFIVSMFYHWARADELNRERTPWVSLIEEYRPTPKPGRKPTPPEYKPYTPIETYLEESERYAHELQAWYERGHPGVLSSLYMDKKPVNKSNPLHYEWAALYQCRSLSPGQIYDLYPDATPPNDADILISVKRTLEQCLIAPREGKAGMKNNMTLLDTLAEPRKNMS